MIDKKLIAELKKNIIDLIAQLEFKVRSSDYEEIGSTSDEDASEFEEFEENVALSNQASKQLTELKAALERIEKGAYGKCEKCQCIIEVARLKEFPATRFCSTHAK